MGACFATCVHFKMITAGLRLLAVAGGSVAIGFHLVGSAFCASVLLLRKLNDLTARIEGHLWTLAVCYVFTTRA